MIRNNEFLIETAKLNPNIDFLTKLNSTDLDWEYILKQSKFHSILQLIYYHCSSLKVIPTHYENLLRSNYVLAESKGRLMTDEYKNVLKRFNEEGVKVIVLKGVYLATKVYKNVALRPFGDMDILIEKESINKVFKILLELGYSQSEIDPASGEQVPLGEDRLQGYEQELQHFGEFFKLNKSPLLKNGFYIDVHHRLSTVFDKFSYNIDEIIDRSVEDYLDETPIFRLSNEDFLTHLCTHLYWHTQSLRDILDGEDARLLAYTDIRSFLQTHEIDWELLFQRAKKNNTDSALYYTLHHAQLLFGDVIPHKIYESWNLEYLNEISNSIYDRWITRDNTMKIGNWDQDFMTRLFNLDRSSMALKSFYEDYLEPILHRGGVLKVVEFGDPNR
ncbi:nucleotidyltransferase family protein [Paenibacillus sp. FSL L8-0340]|uniref:nucleotidyltransferase domain-containing protein n=1 Tax=Paenibacillus sp. FSL L8-0340 TaxID=2954685 RepID=UPI00315847AE